MTPFLIVLWLAQPVLDIRGDSFCPTPAEVSRQLANLAPREATTVNETTHAVLSRQGESVVVELLSADGSLLVERRLEQHARCSELAEAVAVVLAAWHARLASELEPATLATQARPATQVQPPPAASARHAKHQLATSIAFDAGVGLVASTAGGNTALGAMLRMALFPLPIPLGLHAALSLTAARTQGELSLPAEARWSRQTLALGPSFRIGGRPWMLDVHAGGVLALLGVQGVGLSSPTSDATWVFGITAGLRGIWAWRYGSVWTGADFLGYPGHDRLTVEESGATRVVGQLPRLEIQLTLGISLGRFR